MRKKNMIYLVQIKVKNKFVTKTLRDWCSENEMSYNTVLARIWRTKPEEKGGVIYFNEKDEILKKPPQGTGKPRTGEDPPCSKFHIQTEKPTENFCENNKGSVKKHGRKTSAVSTWGKTKKRITEKSDN